MKCIPRKINATSVACYFFFTFWKHRNNLCFILKMSYPYLRCHLHIYGVIQGTQHLKIISFSLEKSFTVSLYKCNLYCWIMPLIMHDYDIQRTIHNIYPLKTGASGLGMHSMYNENIFWNIFWVSESWNRKTSVFNYYH